MGEVRIRVDSIVDDYLSGGDFQKENANMGVTPNGLLFTVGGAALAKDYLKRMLEDGHGEIVELHERGGVHIHDLSLGYVSPYCMGASMSNLVNNGINAGPVPSKPPKHFRAVINHMVNVIGSLCNEVAGAIAFNDVDVYLGAYAYKHYLDMKKDGVLKTTAFKLTRKEIKQSLQELIYHLNQTNRWGAQSPFSNITLALTCPDDMRDMQAMIGDKPLGVYYNYIEDGIVVKHNTYGELEHWQRLVADIFFDLFIEGDATGKGPTFPVLTLNMTEEFFTNKELGHIRKKIWRLTAKYGTPFFQNFINGVSGGKKLNPSDVRSMCPLAGNTMAWVKFGDNEVCCETLERLYQKFGLNGGYFKANLADKWISSRMIRVENTGCIRVDMANKSYVDFERRHEQPVKNRKGEKSSIVVAGELRVGQYLPFAHSHLMHHDTFFEDGYWWVRIEKIAASTWTGDTYCFVVDSEDHLFQLANGLVTHNCRLSLDLQDIKGHTGGIFGNGDSTGSLQVVTISLPYLAKMVVENIPSRDDVKQFFFDTLDRWQELIRDEQLWKRKIVSEYFDQGLFPMCKANLSKGFKTFFCTQGFVGLWECVNIILGVGDGFLSDEGMQFAKDVLAHMKANIDRFTSETGTLFNLEGTPAESASYKLAKKALKEFPDIDHRGLKVRPYFTNSHALPVEYMGDLGMIFGTQSELQVIPSGGTVTHFYLEEQLTEDEIEEAVKIICESPLPYFSLSMVYSMCPICGYVPGRHEHCPNHHTKEQIEALKKTNPELYVQ